jgi:UDP-glucose 4-epimerase
MINGCAMKVLVTGGAGFIGSNVADLLISKNHNVVISDNLSSGKKENINKKAKFYKADIFDKKAVERVFVREKPQVVIHKAAQIDVRKSVADPFYDAQINILGSLNVLDACIKNKVKKIIFASSGGTIYGECGVKAPDETSFPKPISPYGIAKHSVENYIKFYSEVYGLEYTILRYGNVYGPRQDPYGEAGVIAIFSMKMLNNEDITIFGNGKQVRDYVFVKDVADANLNALTRGKNEIINIGTGKMFSLNELTKILSKTVGYNKKPSNKPKRKGELFKSFLNVVKAKKFLNWQPKTDIEMGITETVNYFRKKHKDEL